MYLLANGFVCRRILYRIAADAIRNAKDATDYKQLTAYIE